MSLRESVMEMYARGFRDGERHALDLAVQIMRDVAATAVRWAVAAGGNTPLAIIAKTLREKADALTPAAAPAADEVSDLLGRGHVKHPREGEPGDVETYSSPAPLLPRVLAALEDCMNGACLPRHASLAAELRAYIATAKGEGKT